MERCSDKGKKKLWPRDGNDCVDKKDWKEKPTSEKQENDNIGDEEAETGCYTYMAIIFFL
jgi:hypothetical protein